MTAAVPSVGRFVLRTFLWLPPCFAAWYLGAQHVAPFFGALARMFVDLFRSGLVSALEQQGLDLVFVTTIEVHPAPGQIGVLLVEANPLVYTYGLPFFVALMLAARAKWWKILSGAVVLLPFQAWGIAFDFLAQIVRTGAEVSRAGGLVRLARRRDRPRLSDRKPHLPAARPRGAVGGLQPAALRRPGTLAPTRHATSPGKVR